jgi:malate synthase
LKNNPISYYQDFLSPALQAELLSQARPVAGVAGLHEVGAGGGLENADSLSFLCQLYRELKPELSRVLERRQRDRKFIDERTRSCVQFNRELKRDVLDPDYQTVMGMTDGEGRIVMGPLQAGFMQPRGAAVAPLPEFLQGNHVTLFGPPDDAKLSINAMNAWHRQLKGEPEIVGELLKSHPWAPKWGADDEDSKTPLRADLIAAGMNLTGCLEGTISFEDQKKYQLAAEKRSLPIKRFPGLALPSFFLFYEQEPLPLHLYDFALHFFRNWHNPQALAFYVPKLENEEEARYIRLMMETAESLIQQRHPEYQAGTIRLMIVLENPRAVFRTNEIIDELHPYFAGASLGWHDFLASTARVFKEDPNYRIPVKADPDIVIKYIKASHDLLAQVVGPRGGIKVGGMYGILPINTDLRSPSFQLTIKGYIRDVVTQMKRNLSGFWVAHPDFVRLGMAMVEAWKLHQQGQSAALEELVKSLLDEKHHQEILDFIHGPDIQGLNQDDPLYPRSLIVADLKESTYIANNHPDEIRYNVFQSLQYLTDWLSGNGCVALPAMLGGVPVRVMDDLATAERSRWEVWHELRHGRFRLEEFLKIAHEEYLFIRKDRSNEQKIVQVKWDERTAKWYPVAFQLMLKLMTDPEPVEFATELLLPFTVDSIRQAELPWEKARALDPQKFKISEYIERFNYYFEMCGSLRFAKKMSKGPLTELAAAQKLILSFEQQDILDAAGFHGDIGEDKKTLDQLASAEQSKVLSEDEKVKQQLRQLGEEYRKKFGMKFLISAAGRSGSELLSALRERLANTLEQEQAHAREALWEITRKRLTAHPLNSLVQQLEAALVKHQVESAQITVITPQGHQNLALGKAKKTTWFELASLSKSVASAFAIEFFKAREISLGASVHAFLPELKLDPRLTISHLMSHAGLNLHYVNGVPRGRAMPPIADFLQGNAEYGYEPVKVINPPGEKFQYSGAGFLVLEHLVEKISGASIQSLTRPFLDGLELQEFSFQQSDLPGVEYARGVQDNGQEVEGGRKMFPAFAAGAMGTAHGMAHFLEHLECAWHELDGSGGISHDTARLMLHGTDKGCQAFMGCLMGLGIFIINAGDNKLMLHQGANDGFRCLFLHCFAGPDRGKGVVVLSNADLKGVLFNAEATQFILRAFNLQGIEFDKFKSSFPVQALRPEEVVNVGYKNLIFNAFRPVQPEPIVDQGPKDPLAAFNLVVGAKVIEVTNELFARAENLLSDHLPKFDPELFGKQGKVMDSWETVRHNPRGVDQLVVELKKPSSVGYILLSTKYHFGNHAPMVGLEGKTPQGEWRELLPQTTMEGHAERRIRLQQVSEVLTHIRVSQYPDGGFSRLGLFHELPSTELESFVPLEQSQCRSYQEAIPQTKKPLSINYLPSVEEVRKNFDRLNSEEEFNNASAAYGAQLISATNEHYSPAKLAISPYAPINMFDGLESARSREAGHFDEVVIKLGRPARIHRIEMDFTYFVNNNPLEVKVEALSGGKWEMIVPRTNVKAFAGGQKGFEISSPSVYEQVKVQTIPDGGMNRLRVMSKK